MVRRSALGVRMDRDERGGASRRSGNVGRALVDRTTMEIDSNGGVKLVRLQLPYCSEEP